jgi:large conductance mechanosensitive channel
MGTSYSEDEMLKGFKEFIMRGNVVDLAVAVVIGAAFGAIVTKLVADLITPLIAAIGGKPDFSQLSFTVHKSKFLYGDFINAVISFVIIAAAIYFLVVLPLNKLAERRARQLSTGAEEPEAKAEDVLLLEEIRDLLAAQGGGGTPSPRPRP